MEEINTNETNLNFIYVKNENIKLNEFINSVRLEYAQKEYDFKSSNVLKVKVELKENSFYYKELLIFILKNNQTLSVDYFIYKNKINNIYIDINKEDKCSNKKLSSFEILFQSVNNDLLPQNIIYDDRSLNIFDTFNNNLRKRITLINVDPKKLNVTKDILEKNKDFEFEDGSSFLLLIRIPESKIKKYSVSNLDLIDCNRISIQSSQKKEELDKHLLSKSLKKFKDEVFGFFSSLTFEEEFQTTEKKIDNYNEEYKNIGLQLKIFEQNNLKNQDFENIDIEISNLILYYLEFLEIKKVKDLGNNKGKEARITSIIEILVKYNENYEKYLSEIKTLEINIKDKLLLINSYNKKFIDSIISQNPIDFIQTIIVEKEDQNNAYMKALKFIISIINNLKEESRLFEIFLYLDSEVIENLLINNDKNKSEIINDISGSQTIYEYGKQPSEYGISMLNIDEVKTHLLKLIPKYIIRMYSQMKFNATFLPNSKIMILNEYQIFRESSQKSLTMNLKKLHLNYRYIIPIIMEILHELYGHGKIRLIDDKVNSAEEYRDSKYDFCSRVVKKRVDSYRLVKQKESGVVLESFISDNRKIIQWLKLIHNDEQQVKKIMDASIWTDKNFKKLEKLVTEFIGKDVMNSCINSSVFDTYPNKNGDDLIVSDDDDMCGFHKYDCGKKSFI